MAEREGFEPPVPRGTPDFESGTFDHSATSPQHIDHKLFLDFNQRQSSCLKIKYLKNLKFTRLPETDFSFSLNTCTNFCLKLHHFCACSYYSRVILQTRFLPLIFMTGHIRASLTIRGVSTV